MNENPSVNPSQLGIRLVLVRFALASGECVAAVQALKQLEGLPLEQITGLRTQILHLIEESEQALAMISKQPKA